MMTKNTSSRQAVWNYLAALPVLTLLLLAFSFTSTHPLGALPLPQDALAVLPAAMDSVPDKTKAAKQPAPEKKSDQKVAELFDVHELPVMGACAALQGAERTACSDKELLTYISQNLRYPEAAKKAGVQGVAAARFVIAADGSVTDINIVKGLGSGCDEELTRILNAMPKWVPGKKDGKPVAVAYTLPVKFKLDDQPKQETSSPKVDQMPRFAGCKDATDKDACSMEKLVAYVTEKLEYPTKAKQDGIEGMVVVQFTVGENGAIRNAEVIKSIGGGCDEAVLKLIQGMPAWEPGLTAGKPVAVAMSLPVQFKLPMK